MHALHLISYGHTICNHVINASYTRSSFYIMIGRLHAQIAHTDTLIHTRKWFSCAMFTFTNKPLSQSNDDRVLDKSQFISEVIYQFVH